MKNTNFKNDKSIKNDYKSIKNDYKQPSAADWGYLWVCEESVSPTVVAGPVQWCVSAMVSQRRQGRRLGAGDAQQLTQPRGVASGRGQVDGGTTSWVAKQNWGFLLQQTLDALLLTTQQLGRED